MSRPPLAPEDVLGRHIKSITLRKFAHSAGATLVRDVESTDTAIRREYFSDPRAGLAIVTDLDGIIDTVFLYIAQDDDYARYRGPMPRALPSAAGYAEVHACLGEPQFRRPQGEVPHLGPKGLLERFDLQGYSLHLEYGLHSPAVILLTVMRPPAS